MKKFVSLLVAVAMGAAFETPASALFVDGNMLYQQCTVEKGDALYYQQRSACRSYIIGVTDMFELMMAWVEAPSCLPKNATQGQIQDMVIKYLTDHPEKRSSSGTVIVMKTLQEGFGCTMKPKS